MRRAGGIRTDPGRPCPRSTPGRLRRPGIPVIIRLQPGRMQAGRVRPGLAQAGRMQAGRVRPGLAQVGRMQAGRVRAG